MLETIDQRAQQLASDLCNQVDKLAYRIGQNATGGDYRKTARQARKIIAVCTVITALQKMPYLETDD